MPIAPSSLFSVMNSTHRAKFGSTRAGEATSSLPRSDSSIGSDSAIASHSGAAAQLTSNHGFRRNRAGLHGAGGGAFARGARGRRFLGRVVRPQPNAGAGGRGG